MDYVLLHVEDDPQIRDIVRLSFESFGFKGQVLTADSVKDARNLLTARAQQREPLDLILVDMQLPDGLGLDVIRTVKSDPYWHLTPVVVLSGEKSPRIINDSYALGANCFFPKISTKNNILESLKALYSCWLKGAVLPDASAPIDTYSTCLVKAIQLRARTASYYADLAHAFEDDSDMMSFWLDRSLNEGNFTNLIVFFQGIIFDRDLPDSFVGKLSNMQDQVDRSLRAAGQAFENASPLSEEDVFCRVLDIHEAWDEGCFVEIIKNLLHQSPVAAKTLQNLLVDHLTRVGDFISGRTKTPAVKGRASVLNDWAGEIDNL